MTVSEVLRELIRLDPTERVSVGICRVAADPRGPTVEELQIDCLRLIVEGDGDRRLTTTLNGHKVLGIESPRKEVKYGNRRRYEKQNTA